jgi:S1-C subfamily serine protease
MKKSPLWAVLPIVAVIVLGVACGNGTASNIVERAEQYTVFIEARFPDDTEGSGTGIIFDEDGLIVTNAHVVEGARIIRVSVPDRGNLSAQLAGVSPCDDLAVIKVPGSGFERAQFGDSNDLTKGEEVMVAGYPLGRPDLSFTRGVVSRLHVTLDELQDLIQTDASVNPGNSGGPLLNMRGEVVGIIAVKAQYDQAGNPIEGTAFAISSNLANELVPELATGQNIDWVGLTVIPLGDIDPDSEGLLIIAVSDNSPAERAGLQPQDVLLTMGGVSMNSKADLCDVVRLLRPGGALSYEIRRGDRIVSSEGTPTPPRPTATPTTELIVGFEDDFSDPGRYGWGERVTDNSEKRYENGKYSIFVREAGITSYSTPDFSFHDFVLEVEATQVAGPDENYYGVFFRYVDSDNHYLFAISGDGYCTVLKRLDDEVEPLMEWTSSAHIRQGQSTNHLMVVAEGARFSFYVNGEHLADVADGSFPEGDIALVAGSLDEAGVLIHFDNVTVLVEEEPVPAVAPTAGFTRVFLEDDFSDPGSGWEVGDYETGSVGYKDGAYSVISLGDGATMWGVANRSLDNVVIEVDATQVSAGPDNDNDYGVVCREQGNGDGYHLLISGDGYYAILKSEGWDFEPLVAWTASDVIRQGNATNHIRATCDGPALALFVNGRHLATAEDSTFVKGDIALTATSYEDEPAEVHFDNITVLVE